MADELRALQTEVHRMYGRLEATQRQVAERQKTLEDSLKTWIATELAKHAKARDDFQESCAARDWENQNFMEDLGVRLKAAERQLSLMVMDNQRLRPPVTDMGKRLAERSMSPEKSRKCLDATMEQRLAALEQTVCTAKGAAADSQLAGLDARLATIEKNMQHSFESLSTRSGGSLSHSLRSSLGSLQGESTSRSCSKLTTSQALRLTKVEGLGSGDEADEKRAGRCGSPYRAHNVGSGELRSPRPLQHEGFALLDGAPLGTWHGTCKVEPTMPPRRMSPRR